MVSNAVVEGVAGAVGGIAALLTTYPLMTVSTTALISVQFLVRPEQCILTSYITNWFSFSLQISTLQATRRRKVSDDEEEQPLVVPVKRQPSTMADFAQVRNINLCCVHVGV